MQEHFERIVVGMIAEPGRRVSAIPLLSEAERADILAGGDPPEGHSRSTVASTT